MDKSYTESVVEQLQAQLAELQRVSTSNSIDSSKFANAVAQRDKAIAERDTAIAERDAAAKELARIINSTTAQRGSLTELHVQLRTAHDELETAQKEVFDLRREVNAGHSSMAQLKSKLARREESFSLAKAEYDAMILELQTTISDFKKGHLAKADKTNIMNDVISPSGQQQQVTCTSRNCSRQSRLSTSKKGLLP